MIYGHFKYSFGIRRPKSTNPARYFPPTGQSRWPRYFIGRNWQNYTLNQKLAAEFVGTLFLLATIIGSGIMAERLASGN
uniref:Aquaporin n=1 Tax=OCS116 cluster bacterium TaxID=2030921 RepID=A0A2A4YZQ7_9PROT